MNYFNSHFRIKEDAPPLRSHKPMARTGKKTRCNKKANAQLKREFEAKGIVTCELGYRGCTRDDFLSWAHGKKRRKLQGDELTTCVILACINCHQIIERMSPEAMLSIVQSVIAERGWNDSQDVTGTTGNVPQTV